MLKDKFKSVFARLKKLQKQKPIVSSDHDVQLLQRVHGRRFPHTKQLFHIKKILSAREQMILRLSFLVLIVGLLWFGASLSNNYRIQVPRVGGRYVEAVVGSPELINPIFASLNDVDTDISRLVYSGLMKVDGEQQLVPDLALDYEISEDKKVYTFHLREDVVWHDGKPFTATDVLFTIDTIQNTGVGSPLLVSFQGVKVETLDDYTVQLTLNEPFSAFLSSLTVGILPEHVWFDIAPERVKLAQKNLQPVGTGPFMFKKLFKDETGYIYQYELARFGNYYNSPPYIEEFVFQFFSDYDSDAGAIKALRQQKIDGIHFVPNDLRDQVERKYINLHILQLPQYNALFFNQKQQPVLGEDDIRTALAYALDKDRILREALQGGGQVIYSPILPGFPGYNSEIEKTPYSVEQANELLDEKGWEKLSASEYREKKKEELISRWLTVHQVEDSVSTSTDGGEGNVVDGTVEDSSSTTTLSEEAEQEIEVQIDQEINEAQTFYRKNKNGEILEIKLVTVDTQEYRQLAERIAGFWQEIGVKTQVDFVGTKDFSHKVLKNRSYDVLLYGVIVGSEPDQYPFWHSSQVDFPGLNLSQYVNRNVDALLEQAREASDEEEMVEPYKKFQDLILAEKPAIFLYTPTYIYATNEKLKGLDVSRIFNPSDRFANVSDWYLETEGEWNF